MKPQTCSPGVSAAEPAYAAQKKQRLSSHTLVKLEAPARANACWSVDFMCGSLMNGQRFCTLNVLDDSNREILVNKVYTNIPAARVVCVLDRIAACRSYPDKLRMDNGFEFVSIQLAAWAKQHGIQLEFMQPGKPTLQLHFLRKDLKLRCFQQVK